MSAFGKCIVLFLFSLIGLSTASADSCDALSFQRNAIYKDAGYCFKTAEQIRRFGNAGCRFDDQNDVPLSANDRRTVAAIVAEERASGCR